MIKILFTLCAVFLVLAMPTPASAQKPTLTVDQVIDNYICAVGGQAEIDKWSTRVRKGSTEIVGVPGKGEIEEYLKAPNRMMVKLTLPAIGTILVGFDGTSGWKRDPGSGLVDVRGKQLSELMLDAKFNSELRLRDRFAKLELKGTEKVGGRPAYLVIGTPAGLSPEKLYFDTESGLLVRFVVKRMTEAGEVPDEVSLEDYREVNGVKIPFVEKHDSLGVTYIVRFASVNSNVPIDDSIFTKPGKR